LGQRQPPGQLYTTTRRAMANFGGTFAGYRGAEVAVSFGGEGNVWDGDRNNFPVHPDNVELKRQLDAEHDRIDKEVDAIIEEHGDQRRAARMPRGPRAPRRASRSARRGEERSSTRVEAPLAQKGRRASSARAEAPPARPRTRRLAGRIMPRQ